MKSLLYSPIFGITLTLAAYVVGLAIRNRTRNQFANPLLIAMLLIIALLKTTNIPYAAYTVGGDFITMFVGPATTLLGMIIYEQFDYIKKNWLVVVVGSTVGAITAIGSVLLGIKLFKLDDILGYSLVPKSVTNAIAIELSRILGGAPSITVLAVLITGLSGVATIPLMTKLICPDDPVAQGLAIGASSHLIGTDKAAELGKVQQAMGSVAICITGLVTVILVALLF
ncbi:MAG: LrgB family protein [Sphaerochaetaceae bacterium]|jgi:putative effector of murein hydrolase|nr:LrgB family protein [Sphaerochaetaceae bacterium]NLO60997.1 LrgB family protein [Spirochaetales bacterium]MDD2406664.1 LrgB family protein [Sphaerochaetaceae bacterium]MDD3670979.1 LrgB family protein [Sphaerochaetaceae bacterium]MDD4259785.1 LrgB family protein [Sphaerochaetaceae bacterium]